MDSGPNRNIGRTDLSGELGSVPAPRETDPTPVLIRPPWSRGHEHGKVVM